MTGAALEAHVRVDRGGWSLRADLEAAPGEVVAVMGPSGAGKTTLFDALAGFVPLDSGRVLLDGAVVDAASGARVPPQRRGIVMLGQRARLFPHLSARENVAFGPRSRGVSRRRARDDAEDWLGRVGLTDLGDRRPARLSGGQQQRVALARALATSPRLILLDEPLTSLDPATAAGIRALLRAQLAQTGTTALVATHHPVDAQALAGRLIVLEDGRITHSGPVHDVLGAPATTFLAAVVATLPGRADGWAARIETVESAGAGVIVRARTADGDEVVVQLPPGTPAVVGGMLRVSAGP